MEQNEQDEKLLLNRLKAGNVTAFSEIYAKYGPSLYRNILNLVKLKDEAEEIHQEVFVRLWKYRENIDADRPLQSYLVKIAKNLVVDYYKKAAKDRELQQKMALQLTMHVNDVEESMLRHELEMVMEQIISQLPPQRQRIYRYIKLEQNSYQDAADYFCTSLGTIKDHMAKAAKFVRHKYDGARYQDLAIFLCYVYLS